MLPKAAKLTEPGVHLLERRGVHGIETLRPGAADLRKSALAKNFQMLGHGCLRDTELPLDRFGDGAGTALTSHEKL